MSISSVSVGTAPTLSLTTGIGTRKINWTACNVGGTGNRANPKYAKARLYDSTSGTVLASSHTVSTYVGHQTVTMSISAGSVSVSMPSSNTSHTIVLQYGQTSSSSGTPSSWTTVGTYTITVTGKRTYNIEYYDYAGASYYSTTGYEASYHTVYTPTTLSRFDHWNTAADDSGTSYLPNDTRYVNGNLYFYAIRGAGVIIKAKVSGAWVDAEPKVKVNGAWVDVSEAYVKVNGAWETIS